MSNSNLRHSSKGQSSPIKIPIGALEFDDNANDEECTSNTCRTTTGDQEPRAHYRMDLEESAKEGSILVPPASEPTTEYAGANADADADANAGDTIRVSPEERRQLRQETQEMHEQEKAAKQAATASSRPPPLPFMAPNSNDVEQRPNNTGRTGKRRQFPVEKFAHQASHNTRREEAPPRTTNMAVLDTSEALANESRTRAPVANPTGGIYTQDINPEYLVEASLVVVPEEAKQDDSATQNEVIVATPAPPTQSDEALCCKYLIPSSKGGKIVCTVLMVILAILATVTILCLGGDVCQSTNDNNNINASASEAIAVTTSSGQEDQITPGPTIPTFAQVSTPRPGAGPTATPLQTTPEPTENPSLVPTANPSSSPSSLVSSNPTLSPPTNLTTSAPTTYNPTLSPTVSPTTKIPTLSPTPVPTKKPTLSPTASPTISPTPSPTTALPTNSPTARPTDFPPTVTPTHMPTGPRPIELLLPEHTMAQIMTNDILSPQYRAYQWFQSHPQRDNMPEWRKRQVFALATFFYAFKGEYWRESEQHEYLNYTVPECDWPEPLEYDELNDSMDDAYSFCDQDGRFQQIGLDRFHPFRDDESLLQFRGGSIPPEIALLEALETIEIVDSDLADLRSLLPSEIEHVTTLTNFHFRYIDLMDGAIPSEIGFLRSLTDLSLYDSSLTGTIPIELFHLTKLRHLTLAGNDLSGDLSTELGVFDQFEVLESLDLRYCSFTGTLPRRYLFYQTLTVLNLNENLMTGSIPTSISSMRKLTALDLGWNAFSGIIPAELASLQELTHLDLSRNLLTGTLPNLGSLQELRILDLGGNDISGSLPTQIGLLGELNTIDLADNAFIGTLPTELGLLRRLTNLQLSDNAFTGTIPTELGLLEIEYLGLWGNSLTGSLPPELCSAFVRVDCRKVSCPTNCGCHCSDDIL